MKDITSKEEISALVHSFYSKAMVDETIKSFFTEVVPLNLETHIPLIASFWESVLLGSGDYKGNPMTKHIELNRLKKIEKVHFDRWLELWHKTLDTMFVGPIADQAKTRATQVAQLMQLKIQSNS